MTGVFKNNNPGVIIILFFYGLLLKLPMFLHPVIPQPQVIDGFLYKAFLNWLAPVGGKMPLLYSLIAYALLFSQALVINRYVNSQKLLQRSSAMAGMTYLLISSFFADWNLLSSALIINSLVTWILLQLAMLNDSRSVKGSLLNIGMLTGVGTFIYFPSIAYCVLIILTIVLTRRFSIREWLLVLTGVLVPYYFLAAWVFLADKWKGYSLPEISLQIPEFHISAWLISGLVLIGFCFLVGLFMIQKNFLRLLIQTRKSWNIVYFYLLVSLLVPFLNTGKSFSYWIMAAVPLAVISASVFIFPRKTWFSTAMHWIMVAWVLANQYIIQ